jgi:dipeptidase E
LKSLVIASTSTLHGGTYLNYLKEELSAHFNQADTVLFIPYARPAGVTHDEYTAVAKSFFKTIDKTIVGIHTFKSVEEALNATNGVFVGGGNTFVLVNQLYKNKVLNPLRDAIEAGVPYLGTSAGSNICGLTMNTTNDMPIVYPPSFKTLGIVPFNINPHYLDPDPNSRHMGETRETRIKEFHAYNTQPVIGLREGSWIKVEGDSMVLKGALTARIFEFGKEPYEIETDSELNFLK